MLGLTQSQSQRQLQTLAPQMRQGLDLLQAPAQSLRALIRKEAEANPLLDVEEPPAPSIDAARADWDGAGGSPDSPDSPDSPSSPEDAPARVELGEFSTLGADGADDLYADGGNNEYDPDAEERRQFLFDSIRAEESLQEHLRLQIAASSAPPAVRAVAE